MDEIHADTLSLATKMVRKSSSSAIGGGKTGNLKCLESLTLALAAAACR